VKGVLKGGIIDSQKSYNSRNRNGNRSNAVFKKATKMELYQQESEPRKGQLFPPIGKPLRPLDSKL